MSLCKSCLEVGDCKKATFKVYEFKDGTKYEVCTSHHRSMKVKA